MTGDLKHSILDWLETSGRTLELRTGRAFRTAKAGPVRMSFEYTDTKTGTVREGDVLAEFRWTGPENLPCSITAVVECKSSRKKPWVAFYERQLSFPTSLSKVVAYAHAPFQGGLEGLDSVYLDVDIFNERDMASSIASAFGKDPNSNDSSEPNSASDAVRQVLSATSAMRKKYVESFHTDKRGLVLVPMVVTAAPLFKCRLDAAGEVELEEVEQLVVEAPWEGDTARVIVLHETELPVIAAQLRAITNLAGRGFS